MNFNPRHVNLFHFLVFAPLLIYVGYYGMNNETVDRRAYIVLLILGILALYFHGQKLLNY